MFDCLLWRMYCPEKRRRSIQYAGRGRYTQSAQPLRSPCFTPNSKKARTLGPRLKRWDKENLLTHHLRH